MLPSVETATPRAVWVRLVSTYVTHVHCVQLPSPTVQRLCFLTLLASTGVARMIQLLEVMHLLLQTQWIVTYVITAASFVISIVKIILVIHKFLMFDYLIVTCCVI